MGSSKKQNAGYYYFLGFHMVFCHGPIDKVTHIISDDKVAWEGNAGQETIIFFERELYGGPDKEGGLAGGFYVELGGPTQAQNAYLAGQLAGQLVPNYRGVFGIIAHQVYVGTTTYLKKFAVRASRIHTRTSDGIAQWYDSKAEIVQVADSGELVNYVGFTHQIGGAGAIGMVRGPSFDAQVPAISSIGGGGGMSILALEDRYVFIVYPDVRSSTDGVTWPIVGTVGGSTSDHGAAYRNGQMVYCRGVIGWSYSLDKGVTWVQLDSTTYRMNQACTGKNFILGLSQYSNVVRYTSDVTLGWTDGNADHKLSSGHALWVDYSAVDDQFMFGAYYGVSGPDLFMPWIVSTTDAITLANEILPSAILVKGDYVCGIAAGNNTWVAFIWGDGAFSGTWGSRQSVIQRAGGVWAVCPTVFAFTTRPELRFINGKFLLWVTDANGGFQSADGITWTAFSSTYPISAGFSLIAGDLLLDTRVVGRSDMNPAHIIRECLTDPDWGMGYQDADIDNTAFQAAADTLYTEKMGMSLLWSQQTTIEDFIKEVIKHIDASLFVDKSTGKFNLKLIRNDYVVSGLPVLDPSNVVKVSDFTRKTFGELTNSVTVNFWDGDNFRDASLTVQDIALSQMQQADINTTISYPGFTRRELASRVAQRDLKTLSTPIVSATILANRIGADLNPGSVFKWSWPDFGISNMVMRVVGIAYGNGRNNPVRIQATQDIYGTPDTPLITPEPPYVPPTNLPTVPPIRLMYEVPYYEAVQQQGQSLIDAAILLDDEIGYAGAAVGRIPYGINADVWINSGGGYAYAASVDFSPTASLTANLDKVTTTFAVSNPSDVESAPNGSFFQMGTEIMVKVGYVEPNLTVKRGALDTVPQSHLAAENLIFWDVFGSNITTQYVDGETLSVKVLPTTLGGTLTLAAAPVDALSIVGRMARPYPPAQFKVNASYYPAGPASAIVLTWVERNRQTQTGSVIIGTTDAGVTAEVGTTYNVRVYNNTSNALLYSKSGITALTDSPGLPSGTYNIRIELESVRAGLISYQKHTHIMAFAKTAVLRTLEGGAARNFESGTPQRSLE